MYAFPRSVRVVKQKVPHAVHVSSGAISGTMLPMPVRAAIYCIDRTVGCEVVPNRSEKNECTLHLQGAGNDLNLRGVRALYVRLLWCDVGVGRGCGVFEITVPP